MTSERSHDAPDFAKTAKEAEEAFRFREAFRLYSLAADALLSSREVDTPHPDEVPERATYMMYAARCLEMGEHWRAVSGAWEWLANELGWAIDKAVLKDELPEDQVQEFLTTRYKVKASPEQLHEFSKVIRDAEWFTPPRQDYDGDPDLIRRHQRASAYQWAANHARAARENAEAARLFRRAAVAWEQSSRGDRDVRAANCYFQASLSAAETARGETRRGIIDPWCPACLREKSQESACRHDRHVMTGRPGEAPKSDLLRLKCCSLKAIEDAWRQREEKKRRVSATGAAGVKEVRASQSKLSDTYDEFHRQLAEIQRTVAAHEARAVAVEVYQFRHGVLRQHLRTYRDRNFHDDGRIAAAVRGRFEWARETLMWLFSNNGSSVRRTVLSLGFVYLVIAPLLWSAFNAVHVAEGVSAGPGAAEALVFSLTSLVNLTTSHFTPGGWERNLLQALEAISGVFSFGYLLWISQRSYAD